VLKMNGVSKSYDGKSYALHNINLQIDPGEFVFLVGASGAGKSTFIKLLFREIEPDSGEIFINGVNINDMTNKEVPGLRRRLGIVFQDYRLLPDRTAYENVAFAMRVTEAPANKIRERVKYCLDLVGLKGKERAFPSELSGGEQQRVAVARAFVNDPLVIIADEPTGNLDPETAWDIMNVFRKINESGSTIIMATHDKKIVDTLNKRVIAIDNGIIVKDEKRGRYGY